MKEAIERFGLTEFLSTVCPGAFFLASLLLWWPELGKAVLQKVESAGLTLGLVLVLTCYTAGLLISVIAVEGDTALATLRYRVAFTRQLLPVVLGLEVIFRTPSDPRKKPHVTVQLFELSDRLRELLGASFVSPRSPQEMVAVYRACTIGSVAEPWHALVQEAEAVGRKRLFSQGVALALFLGGVQLAMQRYWWFAFAAVTGSFLLRYVAGRFWEHELIFTWRAHQVSLSPIAP